MYFSHVLSLEHEAHKFEDEIDLSNSFMGSVKPDTKAEVENNSIDVIVQPSFDFPFNKQQIISAQKADETLLTCTVLTRI